jgi:hypothetical protein
LARIIWREVGQIRGVLATRTALSRLVTILLPTSYEVNGG